VNLNARFSVEAIMRIPTIAALVLLVTQPLPGQTWSVSRRPTLSIGAVEGAPEYLFKGVSHARRLSDGRTLVVTGLDLRFYDRNGKFLAKAGGRGSGPGEFQHIADLLVLRGDTLLVLNEVGLVWLTAEGRFIRQEAIDYKRYTGDGWFTEQGAGYLLPSSQFMAVQFAQLERDQPRPARSPLRFAILDATGKLQPLLTSAGSRQGPFSPHAQHAVGTDRIYLGDNDTTVISVFALDGRPAGSIQLGSRAVPVTTQDLDTYRERMLAQIGNNQQRRAQFERTWSDTEKPKRHPYWGVALVDRTGNLWVSDHTGFRPVRSVATAWDVFDRNRQRIASVMMPAGFQPKEIGVDYVLGVARDEFDVEYVHLYSLTRPR
jgi:hypothetical protein